MSEKNKNRWFLGLVLAMLGTVTSGSMWAGALANRVSNLEAAAAVQQSDHDLIIRMNERQENMMDKLELMDKKLDRLNGDDE